MRRTLNPLLALILLLAAASPVSAQTFGQISGQVTDASGGILAGASVVVTNTETNAVREAVTNSAGSYVFPNLLPGVYNLRVDLQGFQPKVMNKIELQVQQTVRMDVSLSLGSVEVAVEVTGTAPMINITDATVGTVVDNKQILELPLNGGGRSDDAELFDCRPASRVRPLHARRHRESGRELQHVRVSSLDRQRRRVQGADRCVLG